MKPHIVLLTGQSGSGKSVAMRALEDEGYYCVDNIPVSLTQQLVSVVEKEAKGQHIALVMDIRDTRFVHEAPGVVTNLRAEAYDVKVLYLTAAHNVLIRRYSTTRRKHPLDNGCGLHDAIVKEETLLLPMSELSNTVVDTSSLTPHELRKQIVKIADPRAEGQPLHLGVMSFGFTHGVPAEADMVFDVRFLANPYFVPELKHLPGTQPEVAEYVMKQPESQAMVDRIVRFLEELLPHYQREGKTYITTAIGCTGGKHRSVAVTESIAQQLAVRGLHTEVHHRDVQKDVP
jgi:UPF0042 nucleotide-binding protein